MLRAPNVVCRSYGDSLVRHEVPRLFPCDRSVTRHLASLDRIARVHFSGFTGTIKVLRLPAVLPGLLSFVRAPVPRTPACVRRRGVAVSGSSSELHRCLNPPPSLALVEIAGSPRFLGNPFALMPCSSTPADRAHPATNDAPNTAFRTVDNVGSTISHLSRLNHTACSLAVYASQLGLLR